MALLVEYTAAGLFPPVAEMRDLKELGYGRKQNTRADKKDKTYLYPYKRVDRIVDRGKVIYK